MATSRQWAFAAVGLSVGLVMAVGCERRENEAQGTTRERSGTTQTAPGSTQIAPGGAQTAPGGVHTAPGTAQTAPGTAETAPGGVQTAPGATASALQDRIIAARCQREQRCGNLGSGKGFANMDACTSATRNAWRGELSAFECSGGVNQDKLDDCVKAIREADCKHPLPSLSGIKECHAADICKNP